MIYHIIRILLTWKIFIIASTLGCLAAATLVAAQYQTIYLSKARVYVEVPGSSSGAAGQRYAEAYLASQIELATDYTVGARAVDLGGLANNQAGMAAYQAAVPDLSVDYRRWLGSQLINSVGVGLNPETSTLEISYAAGSPIVAQQMATLMRAAYIDETKTRLQFNDQREAEWLSGQADKIGEALRLAQARKIEFERVNNVMVTRAGISTDEMRLGSAASTLPPPSAFRGQQKVAPPAPSQGALSEVTAKIEAAKASIGPNHPAMITMREQQEALTKVVSTELAAQRSAGPSVTTTGPSADAAIARGLPNADKIAEAKRLQDDINILEAQYAEFKAKAAEIARNSGSPEGSVEEIGEATYPASSFFPNWPVVIGLSLLLGFVFSCLIALLTEFLSLRVSHESELKAIGVPLLNPVTADDTPVKLAA